MSHIATQPPRTANSAITIPSRPPEPAQLSQTVATAVSVALEPVSRYGSGDEAFALPRTPPALSQSERAEAFAAADRLDAMLRPVSAQQIAAWLRPINAAVANPLAADELAVRTMAISMACADLPAALFTAQAQADAFRRFKFFPAAREVYELVEPTAADWRRQRDALRKAAEGPKIPPAPGPGQQRTAEETAVMSARAKALAAELRAGAVYSESRARVASRPLAPLALIATWEKAAADGLPGASARLQFLRQQFEQKQESP